MGERLSAVDVASLIEEQGLVQPDEAWTSRGLRDEPGEYVGSYVLGASPRTWRLYSAGVVWVGDTVYLLVVGAGLRWWWLTDGRTWWRWRHHLRARPSSDPAVLVDAGLGPEAVTAWAAQATREWIAVAVPSPVRPAVARSREAYCLVVQARIRSRIVDLARMGVERSPEDFVRGVSPDWSRADLETPSSVTIQHAVAVSLVLALPAEEAADLVEVAAWLHLGGAWVDRQAAVSIHAAATRQLAALLPPWWVHGAALDWSGHGVSVSGVFRAQHLRTLLHVEASGLPYGLAGALAQARSMPEGQDAAQEAGRALVGALGDPVPVR